MFFVITASVSRLLLSNNVDLSIIKFLLFVQIQGNLDEEIFIVLLMNFNPQKGSTQGGLQVKIKS